MKSSENVVEYMRRSDGTQKREELNVTVYVYKREMERVRKKKNGGMDHWIV